MISYADVGYAQKCGSDYGDVSTVPLESHDYLWLRAKSLHLTMIERKMN